MHYQGSHFADHAPVSIQDQQAGMRFPSTPHALEFAVAKVAIVCLLQANS
jgi:hypothetical protein